MERLKRTGWALLLAVLGVACIAPAALADDAQDLAQGHILAIRICAACHAVPTGTGHLETRPILRPPAPRLILLANGKGMTADFLTQFLAHPHGAMPDPRLADYEIDSLVRYVMSLRNVR